MASSMTSLSTTFTQNVDIEAFNTKPNQFIMAFSDQKAFILV